MTKTQEELNTLKQECESLTAKLNELSEDELKQIIGGFKVKYKNNSEEDLSFWDKLLKIFNKIGG